MLNVFLVPLFCCQHVWHDKRGHQIKVRPKFYIDEPGHLLHLDLFDPVNIMSTLKKRYVPFIVNEHTRYTWVHFLHRNDEIPAVLFDHVWQL